MATLGQKIAAERSGRAMLEKGGLRQPDHVEYGHTCIRFFWEEEKLVLVIDIDAPPEGFERVGVDLADAARELAGPDPHDPSTAGGDAE
jgi:hypothetical protein